MNYETPKLTFVNVASGGNNGQKKELGSGRPEEGKATDGIVCGRKTFRNPGTIGLAHGNRSRFISEYLPIETKTRTGEARTRACLLAHRSTPR